MIDDELIKILLCPACKSSVRLELNRIVCSKCCRRYPIVNGILVMLVEEAEDSSGRSNE